MIGIRSMSCTWVKRRHTDCFNQDGLQIIDGEAVVRPPKRRNEGENNESG
jgi:hypothetical protein